MKIDTLILGLSLECALAECLDRGCVIKQIKLTAPPRRQDRQYDNSYRIVRVDYLAENEISILVCKPL